MSSAPVSFRWSPEFVARLDEHISDPRGRAGWVKAACEERMAREAGETVGDLVKVGAHEIKHVYNGSCPDAGGRSDRDPDCPACRVLILASGRMVEASPSETNEVARGEQAGPASVPSPEGVRPAVTPQASGGPGHGSPSPSLARFAGGKGNGKVSKAKPKGRET